MLQIIGVNRVSYWVESNRGMFRSLVENNQVGKGQTSRAATAGGQLN